LENLMITYIFYVGRSDGAPTSLEVHGLNSDEAAADRAKAVLAEHSSADYVTVARGDVTVVTQHRDRDVSRSAASAAGATGPAAE
jgi:hypothetical protein